MKGLGFIKNFIPLSLLYALKYCKAPFNQKQPEGFSRKKKIILMDAPDYGNIGDQAIAYAVRKYAEEKFPEYDFVEITYNELPFCIKFLKSNITSDDIIFLTGGGNMGNRYRIFEAARRKVIKTFQDNKTVVFPQTIDYSDNIFGKLSFTHSRRIYSSHKALALCAREEYSYEIMKTAYPKNKVLLCPDIVLSLENPGFNEKRTQCGICLRNDQEGVLTQSAKDYIIERAKAYYPENKVLTTSAEIGCVTKENRDEVVTNKLREFSQCNLVITDRLHAMIFSAITETPCIVFRNSNRKIIGVHEWVEHLPYIVLLKDASEIDATIEQLAAQGIDKKFCRIEIGNIAETMRKIDI